MSCLYKFAISFKLLIVSSTTLLNIVLASILVFEENSCFKLTTWSSLNSIFSSSPIFHKSTSIVLIIRGLYKFENLESNQRGADLTLMLAGGWIESVYLMSYMVKDFEKDKNTAERIVDQKLALENLIEFSAM